ncbi:MAG: hypothetical protein AB2A00_23700 [Myxococcota bacterium]
MELDALLLDVPAVLETLAALLPDELPALLEALALLLTEATVGELLDDDALERPRLDVLPELLDDDAAEETLLDETLDALLPDDGAPPLAPPSAGPRPERPDRHTPAPSDCGRVVSHRWKASQSASELHGCDGSRHPHASMVATSHGRRDTVMRAVLTTLMSRPAAGALHQQTQA